MSGRCWIELQRHYRPLKMNYEVLGNALPHLHTHLVPRYLDDPAPGRPFPFLGVERPNLPGRGRCRRRRSR